MVSLLIVLFLIVRVLEPVILLFALVFLLAMVLNPIVVWLQKHYVPRFAGVILLMLVLVAVTATIMVFAIPPLARQTQELVCSAPSVWQGIRIRMESITQNYPTVRRRIAADRENRRESWRGCRNGWKHFVKVDTWSPGRRGQLCAHRSLARVCAGQSAPACSRVPWRSRPIVTARKRI